MTTADIGKESTRSTLSTVWVAVYWNRDGGDHEDATALGGTTTMEHQMSEKTVTIYLEGEYTVGSGRIVFIGQELVEAITHFNLARDAAAGDDPRVYSEVEIGLAESISVEVTTSSWGNPDCDAGHHARTQVSFRRWPFIWRLLVEWRCWNCDWESAL